MKDERDNATQQLASARAELSRLNSPDRLNEILRLRGEVGELRLQVASLEAKSGSPSMGFAGILKDPAMRDYIRQTQLNYIRSRFGPLFNELKLTPEQTEQVVGLLGDLFMKNTDNMYALPQGTLSAAEIAQASAEREAELTRQLEPLLGEKGVARFNEFRHEFPAEATVALVNGQLGVNQLSDEQSTRLRQVVKNEPFDLTRGISGDWDPAFWGSSADIDKHLSQLADSNQHILQQANDFLKPEQWNALSNVLNNGVNERLSQAAAFIQKH